MTWRATGFENGTGNKRQNCVAQMYGRFFVSSTIMSVELHDDREFASDGQMAATRVKSSFPMLPSLLQFFDSESRRQRLLQLFGLLAILDDQSVEVSAASYLEKAHELSLEMKARSGNRSTDQ